MLDAANTEVARLKGELAAAPTDADVAAVQTMLDDANTEVARLKVLLAAAPPTTGDVAAVQKLLDDANAEVIRLGVLLAAAPPTTGDVAAMLDAANAKVTRLETQIGDPADPANAADTASLYAQLNAAKAALVTAMVTAIDAFETAQNSRDDAEGAATTAEEAVKAATEASGKIMTLSAVGDSAAAEANAQAVLDAQAKANAAVTTAQAAVDDAKTALAAVDPAGAYSSSLTRALEAAIEVAEAELKKATDEAESATLKTAVALVTGDDPDDEDYPMTPAQHGRAVAMDIDAALSPDSETDGARKRGTHTTSMVPAVPAAPAADTVVRMNDHQGSTWEEIVGAANVSDKRIGVTGGGTTVVKAASVAGMTLTSPQPVDEMVADGTQTEEDDIIMYKGIPGTVFCEGSDCAVEAVVPAEGDEVDTTVKKLIGSWYFTPADDEEWYVGTTTAGVTTHRAETLYAQFGHWLVDSNNDNNAEVNTYALNEAESTTAGTHYDLETVNTAPDATVLLDTSASYRGPAAGMSVHQTTNADGEITQIDSAAFTATVNLRATFGTSPTLAGTVNDFQGDAIDSSWSVELQSTGFNGILTVSEPGVTIASGRNGEWTATAYGSGNEVRPTGIFGGFNAHFTDGHAAGAYATRK